jgi:hypothetical protein
MLHDAPERGVSRAKGCATRYCVLEDYNSDSRGQSVKLMLGEVAHSGPRKLASVDQVEGGNHKNGRPFVLSGARDLCLRSGEIPICLERLHAS